MTLAQTAARRPEPVPGAWPVAGHLPAFGRDPLGFLGALPGHGDLVEVRSVGSRMYIPCRPELAHKVLSDRHAFDRTGPIWDRFRGDIGNGVATCLFDEHRRQRLMVQPAFRRDRMGRYADLMSEEIGSLGQSWRPGQVIDVVQEMFALTTSVAVRTLFSSRVDVRTTAMLRQCMDTYLRGLATRALLPAAAARLPLPVNRRHSRALAQWRHYVREVITAGRQRESGAQDLLAWLIEARDDDRAGLTEQELFDQIMVIVLGGAESLSALLSWAWHLLGTDPEAEAELLAEADAALDGRTATLDDLPRLEHTGRVLKEALRLYPPAWGLLRSATKDVELGGRRLPAGAAVLVSPFVVQRRPDIYAAPHAFRPGRWLPDPHTGRSTVPPAAYFPFGIGGAKCLGEHFALTMASLAMASLATRWRLLPVPGVTVRPAVRAVISPRALTMRVTARR